MVENAGKALRTGALKPLNLPGRLAVVEKNGLPAAIEGKGRRTVDCILDNWRLDDEWWRDKPLSRLYFEIVTTDGCRLVIFKDLASGDWYRQRY